MNACASQETQRIEADADEWFARRDAGLNAAEEAEFARWIAADPRHASAFAATESLWTRLHHPRRNGAAATVKHELAALQRKRRRRKLTLAIASIAIVFTLGTASLRRTKAFSPEMPHSSVLVPERRVLPDGSIAELKHDARIAVNFTARSSEPRLVTLEHGEAHFQVAKNKDRPFIVRAGVVEIVAVGTAFAVDFSDSKVEVVVTEGRIAIQEPSKKKTADPEPSTVFAGAGNRVVIATPTAATAGPVEPASPEVIPISAQETGDRLAWRNPRVEFSRAPLSEVIALVNQHNRAQFRIEDPALASMTLSGVFRADDADALSRALEGSFGIRAERRSPTETLLRHAP